MKRHSTDLLSLLPGLLFVAIAVLALAGGLTVDLLSADWVWPSVLIALGLLVLASAGLGRRGSGAPDEASASQDEDDGVATVPDPRTDEALDGDEVRDGDVR